MTEGASASQPAIGRGTGSSRWGALAVPFVVLALALSSLAVWACGQSEEAAAAPEIIPRETFVSAYVDLRMAALLDTGTISSEERERILESHGVTPADLLQFVEVYGEDPPALQEVWNDVQDRIREAREEAALEREEEVEAGGEEEP